MKVANISGGRTSAYMGIALHDRGFDGIYCFQNTGMEAPETISFLKGLPFPIIVLQYKSEPPFFTIETLDSLNMTGEPFKQLVRKRKAVPNMEQRFCTDEMKILTMRRYMRSIGVMKWSNYLGIRHDEPERIKRIKENYGRRGGKTVISVPVFPLDDMKITAKHIGDFWRGRPDDLKLPMLPNGKTICGNCIGCFHKSEAELAMTIKRYPKQWEIMEGIESEMGHTFRKNKSLSQLRDDVTNDLSFDFNIEHENYCTTELGSCGD